MTTPLEEALLRVPAKEPIYENNVDILRQVLTGELGTPSQRNALLRIIRDVRTKFPPITARLNSVLNLTEPIPAGTTHPQFDPLFIDDPGTPET